jgi:hypothetical protein
MFERLRTNVRRMKDIAVVIFGLFALLLLLARSKTANKSFSFGTDIAHADVPAESGCSGAE